MRPRTAAESPRLAHGPAPHPPPAAPARSSSDRVELPKAHRCRACTAIAWLLTTQALPDGWHVAVGQHAPTYHSPLCASAAGLTVAPAAAGAGIAGQDLDVVRAAHLAQLAEIRAGLAAFMAELAADDAMVLP